MNDRNPFCARALDVWPRLDRARLARTKGDPVRIARLVTGRTALTLEGIIAILAIGQEDRADMGLAKEHDDGRSERHGPGDHPGEPG